MATNRGRGGSVPSTVAAGIGIALVVAVIVSALWLTSFPQAPKEQARPQASPGIAFENVTSLAGIDYMGGSFGAAWGDVDGNGYPDLWASGHSPLRLLVNQEDGTFVDRTKELVGRPRYSDRHNASWADFDNDGDEDLLQLSGADRGFGEDPNSLYVNRGDRLKDEAKALGLDYGKARARAAVWLDLNRDGWLDVIVTAARREEAPPAVFLRNGQVFDYSPLGFVEESEIAQLAMFGSDAKLHLISGLPSQLFVHEIRDAKFLSVGEALSITKPPGTWVTDTLTGDFDNDLFQDLVLVRGRLIGSVEQQGPRLVKARLQSYRNQPQTIQLAGPEEISVQPYPRAKQWWGKGKVFIGEGAVPPSDFPIVLARNDAGTGGLGAGSKGLFVGFDTNDGVWQIQLRDPDWNSVNLEIGATSDISEVSAEGLPEEGGVAQLLFWNGTVGFERPVSGAFGKQNCFSGASGDFDNDGDLDLYFVCSGLLRNTENLLFENLGNRTLRSVEGAGGARGADLGIGDSVAIADYDLDGFLDLFVRNGRELMPFGNGPDELFRNMGNANHWIELDLEGSESNRNGIGARIIIESGGHKQMRVVDNGAHGYVQDFRRAHFGLGKHTLVDTIEVQWPSGNRTLYSNLPADQILLLEEAGGVRRLF